MRRLIVTIAFATMVGAILAVAAVGAVRPASGHYAQLRRNGSSVVTFELKGSKLYSFTQHFDAKCAVLPITSRFVTKVKAGAFTFKGTLKAGPARYAVSLSGRFTSSTRAAERSPTARPRAAGSAAWAVTPRCGSPSIASGRPVHRTSPTAEAQGPVP